MTNRNKDGDLPHEGKSERPIAVGQPCHMLRSDFHKEAVHPLRSITLLGWQECGVKRTGIPTFEDLSKLLSQRNVSRGLKIFADLQNEASDPWPARDLTPEATLPKPMGNIRSLRGAVAAMWGKQRARLTAKLPPQLPTIVLSWRQ